MYELTVFKKCGFHGNNPQIYDDRGIFYEKGGEVTFNLPPGIYYSKGYLGICKPVKYRIPKMPIKEKRGNNPNNANVSIYSGEGPLGAVHVGDNNIFLREDLMDKTTPEIMCVLFHELGHYYYYTEKYCDIYAINTMLKIGYNPSQFKNFLSILSDKSMRRKIFLTKHAKKIRTDE